MTARYPLLLLAAVVVTIAAVTAYVVLQRRRAAALAGSPLAFYTASRRTAVRRHLPFALFLAALAPLLVALAGPQAVVEVPRVAGTVILAFDASNSMAADDVEPSRFGAVQEAATRFVRAQPATVDIGVVVFGPGALTTQLPTDDHEEAIAAINRPSVGGGTSLSAAILASLTAIVGEPVTLPDGEDAAPPDLGYWGSATIVIFSDGEDTTGRAEEAAALAAAAGVRIETVGIGTAEGTTVEVDGYQVATARDDDRLASLAEITGGSYHQPQDTAALDEIHRAIDLRVTTREEPIELTAPLAGVALLLLTAGALLMIRWHGRIV
jgi:Ca-activated chloride channel family protein